MQSPRTGFVGTIRAATAQAARDTAYLSLGLLTSCLALAVWVVGLSLSLSLIVFLIGIPVVIGSAIAFRWTAELDRRNASWLLERPIRGGYRARGTGMRGMLTATVRDPQTSRDLVWLVLHSWLGFTFGCVALGLVFGVAGLAVFPAWFWSLPDGADLGLWHVDSTGEALAAIPLALPLAVVTVVLLRAMARAESGLAVSLLAGDDDAVQQTAPMPDAARRRRFDPDVALSLHVALTGLVALLMLVIWVGSGGGYFWPAWVWLGISAPLGIHVLVRRAQRAPAEKGRSVRVHAEFVALISGWLTIVWALAGGGEFWPFWPALGLSIPLAIHGLIVFRDRLGPTQQELVERVDELTRTRRGALDVQAAELRRIERDLHDGAQARLVSLSMLVGRAEEQLEDRPEVAALVRRAREEASAAIGELRDLARGIAPPVLADRGLNAAVQALGVRAPMPVTVEVPDERRPPPVVETAAYFVVAEALTNVAKHAGGAPAKVVVSRTPRRLVVEVSDEGPGGANPAGGGLTGLRHRVEAIDGTLKVTSPAGGPTTIRAELPCAS
jgi:signal transduction histidine kinase